MQAPTVSNQPVRWSRVLLGGIVAGIAVFVIDGVGSIVYIDELTRILATHDLSFGLGPASLVLSIGLSFGVGCGAVWLYAVLLPRYGPGLKAAGIAGLAVWVLWFVPSTLAWSVLGLFPAWMATYSLAVAAVEAQAAALLGAWLYREPRWVRPAVPAGN